MTMSRLFNRPSTKLPSNQAHQDDDDPNSVFSSLLNPIPTTISLPGPPPPHRRRTKSTPGILAGPDASRPWLSLLVAAEQDRPAKRKLIKEPGGGGSARPSFSVELGDRADDGLVMREKDGGEGKVKVGAVRRGLERIRELYRREKG